MRQAGGLHHLSHGYVLKSSFSEEARGLLHDSFMSGGGFLRGVTHFPESSIYDDHHITGMMAILVEGFGHQGGIMKLAGKKALITGGNSGIGLATARLFISEGAEVAITGRDQHTLDEAVAELGSKARGYRADVTVAEDRKKLFAELAKDLGKLDIVFANAGISGRTPTGATDEAIFEKVVHTNLSGAFFTVNSAAPLMNDNGSVIFNGSVHNYLGQPGVAAYAASKGGLVSMARSIAADLAPRKIRVNVVAPGATKTPIWKRGARANATAEESAKVADFFSSTVPLGRWGEPEDLAKAVLFLASDDSSYINAVELMVDGGLTGAPFGAAILRG